MKKHFLSILLAAAMLLLLLPLSVAAADGPANWDPAYQAYVYNVPRYGIVICRQMKVRDQPATRGREYGSIKNGQPVKIIGTSQNGDFYLVNLASCGFAGIDPNACGFAKASLIKIDPQFIATTKLTNLYATPWSTEFKNGEQTGRFFLVIDQANGWYAVQTNESTVGTSFILSRDVGNYSNYSTKYVVTWETSLLDEYSYSPIQTLKRFSVGTAYSLGEDFSMLIFNEGQANEVRGWVNSQYIAPIIN